MNIDVKDKFFWFVFLELLFGFAASVVFITGGALGNAWTGTSDDIDELLARIFVPGAFLPLLLRSNLYVYKKQFDKVLTLVLYIFALVMYIGGGVFIILGNAANSNHGTIQAVFALIVGALLIVDLIFQMVG